MLTGTEARAAAERASGPQVAMHYSSSNELQEQIQRVLELVIQTRSLDCCMHGARQRRMRVGVQQEPGDIGKSRDIRQQRMARSISSTHPRNSKKRQITLATISSFLSNGGFWPALTLVLAASLSETVAPRHNAKSIVED